jgi:hypothetical protein
MAKSKHRKKVISIPKGFASIDRAIATVRKGLAWEVKTEVVGNECDIVSDESERCHHIRLPSHDPYHGTAMLHELCHAHLAESAHPLFGSNIFSTDTEKEWLLTSGWAFKLAGDWFVDELGHAHVPAAFNMELKEDLAPVSNSLHLVAQMSPAQLSGVALVIAQSMRYLQHTVAVDGILAELVQACLASDPSNPTVENLTALVNRLLLSSPGVQGRVMQVECVLEGGIHVWRFIKT